MSPYLGITDLPVSEEADPGFGPDTEQRRVEFATKLEDEAFTISVSDATKLARRNLITALKLWDQNALIPLVSKLTLDEIMLFWLLFEISYISEIFRLALSSDELNSSTASEQNFKNFIKNIFEKSASDIKPSINNSRFRSINKVKVIRKSYGDDILFSLKAKNEEEVIKLYEITYSKIPHSLREKFKEIIIGVSLDIRKIIAVTKANPAASKKGLVTYLFEKLQKNRKEILTRGSFRVLLKLLTTFDAQLPAIVSSLQLGEHENGETEKRVKRLYGINPFDSPVCPST